MKSRFFFIFVFLNVIELSLLRRIKKMVEQRQALIEERRKASIATKLQKESIAKMMEEVRTNASKASKIIKKAMSGKIGLDTLLSSPSKSPSRSRSADKSSVRKHKQEMSSEYIGLGRSTNSAPGSHAHDGDVDLKYSLGFNKTAPEPYVSPYITAVDK